MPELNVLDPFPRASNRRLSPTDRLDGPGKAHLVRPYPACNHPLRYHAGAGLACHPLCQAPTVVLAGLHFAIDAFKNFLATRKPGWIVGPYLFDQFLHLISIGVVALPIMSSLPTSQTTLTCILGYPLYRLSPGDLRLVHHRAVLAPATPPTGRLYRPLVGPASSCEAGF